MESPMAGKELRGDSGSLQGATVQKTRYNILYPWSARRNYTFFNIEISSLPDRF